VNAAVFTAAPPVENSAAAPSACSLAFVALMNGSNVSNASKEPNERNIFA